MLKLKKINSNHDYLIDIYEKTSIGRETDNDIVIDSYEVSRHHCLITFDEKQNVYVKDLNSLNGTFINNEKIDRVKVDQYDVLQIGDESYVFINAENVTQQAVKQHPDDELKSILLNSYSQDKINAIIIKLVDEGGREKRYPSNSIYTIGRLQFSDIVIDDESVSRTHATIDVRENRVVITDSNSTNGTFVNNKEVTQQILKNGDTLGIGESNIIINFEILKKKHFSTLSKKQNMIAINMQEDYESLIGVYKNEYNLSVLLEVERQSLIFCQEFEQYCRVYTDNQSIQERIVKFLELLSNCKLIMNLKTNELIVGESVEKQNLYEECIQSMGNMLREQTSGEVIYFENIQSVESPKIIMNGLVIMIGEQMNLLILDVPYENLLYLTYISNWVSHFHLN